MFLLLLLKIIIKNFFSDSKLKPPVPPKNATCGSAYNYYTNLLVEHPLQFSSGTPDQNLNDYELCLIQKSKLNGNITKLIQTENMLLKKGSNNQLILHSRVPSQMHIIHDHKTDVQKFVWGNTSKPEDSGYLSTDSNDSQSNKMKYEVAQTNGDGSETDESLGDGHSESGAESIETHSVFFNRFSRHTDNFGSMDSGVMGEELLSSSDSESMSFTTIVPVTTC